MRVLNIAEVLSKLAAPLLVLSFNTWMVLRVSFNPLQVTGLSLKRNGQRLRGENRWAGDPFWPSTLRSPFSSLWFYAPYWVIVWFWALGFLLGLWTCFLLETPAFCICWHPVSKPWRETLLSFVAFRKGSSCSREALARMVFRRDSIHYAFVKWELHCAI